MIEHGVPGATATKDALAGSAWEILSVDGQAIAGVDAVVISFGHDGRVSGSTGVNQLTASYSVTADYVTFGPLATSRHTGAPVLMDQEHRIVASLAGMCPFRLGARNLSIDGPYGRVEMVAAGSGSIAASHGQDDGAAVR